MACEIKTDEYLKEFKKIRCKDLTPDINKVFIINMK